MKNTLMVALLIATPGLAVDAGAAECPKLTKVTVTAKNPAAKGIDWTIRKAAAFRNESVHTTSIHVYLSTYDFTARNAFEAYKAKPGPDQAQLNFTLTRQVPGAKQGLAVPPGPFDFTKAQGQAERTGSVDIRLPKGVGLQLNSHKTKGTFELVSVGPKQACGTFRLEDDFTQIAGEFVADFPQATK